MEYCLLFDCYSGNHKCSQRLMDTQETVEVASRSLPCEKYHKSLLPLLAIVTAALALSNQDSGCEYFLLAICLHRNTIYLLVPAQIDVSQPFLCQRNSEVL